MSISQPTDETKAKPKRSVTERVIVQGGIVVLLIIVAFEGLAYFQMKLAHGKLITELKNSETSGSRLTKEGVTRLLGGRKADVSVAVKAPVGEENYDLYYFRGLLKRRELWVHYGIQGKVDGAAEVVEVISIVPDEVLAKTQN